MTAHDIHIAVLRMMPKDAPLRGFLRMVNWTLEKIRERGHWSFDFTKGYIDVPASYDTGTVAVTSGDATVTGTDTVWSTSVAVAGRIMRINGEEYTILSRTSDTELELTKAFGGASASGLTYIIYQNEFQLDENIQTVHRVWDQTNNCKLLAVDQLSIKDRAAVNDETGSLQWYAAIGADIEIPRATSGVSTTNRRILVGPPPTDYARLEYWAEKGTDKVTLVGDEIDLPAELDELVVQGVYSRAMEIARVDTWKDARAEFMRMLENRWAKDRLLHDTIIRNRRADTDFMWPVFEPRHPTRIEA